MQRSNDIKSRSPSPADDNPEDQECPADMPIISLNSFQNFATKVKEKLIDMKENQLKQLENNFKQLKVTHAKEILELQCKHKEECDDLLQQVDTLKSKNSLLEIKVDEQEALLGLLREQLSDYEIKHSALLSQDSDAENEAASF